MCGHEVSGMALTEEAPFFNINRHHDDQSQNGDICEECMPDELVDALDVHEY